MREAVLRDVMNDTGYSNGKIYFAYLFMTFKLITLSVHNNYVFTDINKEPHALSLCLTGLENHGIPQYRAILWKKSVRQFLVSLFFVRLDIKGKHPFI